MGAFYCPTCEQVRHIEEPGDPRKDHCWKCGTLVPYSAEELARFAAEGILPDDSLPSETEPKEPHAT